MKLWSFDVRSGGPSQVTLLEEVGISLEGTSYSVKDVRMVLCLRRAHPPQFIAIASPPRFTDISRKGRMKKNRRDFVSSHHASLIDNPWVTW
jgi:hypothetical protein